MRARPSKYTRSRMRYGRAGLKRAYVRVKRMCCATGVMEFTNTTTPNFCRFISPSLNVGMVDFKTGNTIISFNNLAEFENLFDQYKLHGIKYTFRPKINKLSVDQTATAGPTYQNHYVCIHKDYASTTNVTGLFNRTTLNGLLESGGKIYRADRTISVWHKPRIAEQYGGGATRFVTPKWTTLNTSGKAAEYPGFWFYAFNQNFDATALATQLSFEVMATYYVSFRDLK